MFVQVRNILAAGGATPDQLVRMTVWLKDRSNRAPLNEQWIAMFPDPRNRPARVSLEATGLTAGILVQCEITAYIA
jgi:enamine deaminase RidA (YjgF/YER057c/UK114 family)